MPSVDDHDIDEDEEDEELIHNHLDNPSDIEEDEEEEEERRFPLEDDDDNYSTKMNKPLVDEESINQ